MPTGSKCGEGYAVTSQVPMTVSDSFLSEPTPVDADNFGDAGRWKNEQLLSQILALWSFLGTLSVIKYFDLGFLYFSYCLEGCLNITI